MLYGLLSHPVRLLESGPVKSTPGCITAVQSIGGGAQLRNGGASGTIVWEVPAGEGIAFTVPILFDTDIYCEFLTGATAVNIAYQELQE